jgi:hypothetical protein
MAASVTLNPLDFLNDDEQATLEELLEQPLSETKTEKKKQGWTIRFSPAAFVNCYKAPQLATGFINLCKHTYSLLTIKRINTGGNFCGHDPKNPRFVMQHHAYFDKQEIDDLGNKRRPKILYHIVQRIKAYYDDPDVIPVLHTANSHLRTSDKQRRSEFREAAVNLLSIMIMNMDLASLRVGQPMLNGGFFNYSLEWLAGKAQVSKDRAKHVMSDLNNATIIASYQYRELIDKEKKEYIAHNAARVFDMDFFRMLKIDLQMFGEARKVSHQKHKANQQDAKSQFTEKEQAVSRMNMNKIMNMVDPQKNKLKSVNLPENEEISRQENRRHKRRTQVFLELREDPRYQDDDAAFEEALQQRLTEMNLLHPQEKMTQQNE